MLDASINQRSVIGNEDITSSPSRTNRLKRSNSDKKRNMMKKLNAYYQTLVQPCEDYTYKYKQQEMLDGSDIDALIRKKRAHKNIMAEAFDTTKKTRSRLIISKKKESKKEAAVAARPAYDSFGSQFNGGPGTDLPQIPNGYIIEDGGIIPIDMPSLKAMNKYALDVITTEVTDHIAEIVEDEEATFNKLKGNLFNKVNARAKSKPGTGNTLQLVHARSLMTEVEPKEGI